MNGKRRISFLVVVIIMTLAFVMSACSSVTSGAKRGVERGVSDGVSNAISGAFGSRSGPSVGSSGSSSSRSSGSRGVRTVPWPNDATWTRYGLSGFQQPPGTQVTGASMVLGYYSVVLLGGGEAAFNNLCSQLEKIPETMVVTEMTEENGILRGFMLPTGNMIHIVWAWGEEKDGSEDEIGIQAYPIR